MSIKIEVLSTPGCSNCARARESLKAVALAFGEHRVTWCEVNVLDEVDYAVELGVLIPPSMAIDGELVFPKLPDAAQLREELVRRLDHERSSASHRKR
ncbi:MAG TPA: thioredoxin family protein [Candidatus Binataceae bacterium]|nr:thioredoxin family protein [Candidatus Binataceae bacterium]